MGHEKQERLAGPESEKQAERATGKSKQNTFGDQLTNQTASSGSDGEAHCNLPLAGISTRQQQICDVRAGDEKEENDDRHHDHQRLGESATERGESLSTVIQMKPGREQRL